MPSHQQVLNASPELTMNTPAASVETLFAAHRGELVAFAERRLGSHALAEDVVQQAALRALGGVEALRDPQSGRAWLFTIVRRLLVDHFRTRLEAKLTREPEAEVDAADFGCSCVLANVAQLKPEFAHVLRRVVFEEAPLATVATELGLSTNAATVRLSRARAALRDQLRAHCGTESLQACLDCACDERGCCTPTPHSHETTHDT